MRIGYVVSCSKLSKLFAYHYNHKRLGAPELCWDSIFTQPVDCPAILKYPQRHKSHLPVRIERLVATESLYCG